VGQKGKIFRWGGPPFSCLIGKEKGGKTSSRQRPCPGKKRQPFVRGKGKEGILPQATRKTTALPRPELLGKKNPAGSFGPRRKEGGKKRPSALRDEPSRLAKTRDLPGKENPRAFHHKAPKERTFTKLGRDLFLLWGEKKKKRKNPFTLRVRKGKNANRKNPKPTPSLSNGEKKRKRETFNYLELLDQKERENGVHLSHRGAVQKKKKKKKKKQKSGQYKGKKRQYLRLPKRVSVEFPCRPRKGKKRKGPSVLT